MRRRGRKGLNSQDCGVDLNQQAEFLTLQAESRSSLTLALVITFGYSSGETEGVTPPTHSMTTRRKRN